MEVDDNRTIAKFYYGSQVNNKYGLMFVDDITAMTKNIAGYSSVLDLRRRIRINKGGSIQMLGACHITLQQKIILVVSSVSLKTYDKVMIIFR
jgi:hypothetical protein